MPDELMACKYCGGAGVIVAFRVEGQLFYQGQCRQCGQVAVDNTNYDRAVDFWQSWQAQRDKPVPQAQSEDDEEDTFTMDLALEHTEESEPEDEEPTR